MKRYTRIRKRRNKYKKKGSSYDQQFTMDGRQAEIRVDLVLQARAKMNNHGVSGPEDTVVSEMIKILLLKKIYTATRCFQERFVGQLDSSSSWDCETGALAETRRGTKEADQKLQSDSAHKCHVGVGRVLCDDAYGKGEGARDLENISCGRSQQDKLSTSQGVGNKSITETLGMARGNISHVETLKHGSVVRPTVFMACLDIKTAFDEARPGHVAKLMESHDTHGWLIAAFLREMSGLEGRAMFECVESSFICNRCLRQGSV